MKALPLTIARFDTAFLKGPALGTQTQTTWGAFATLLRQRREGTKDGPNFVPARFNPEPDGRVRRLIANVAARTAIALDCETSKGTGEIPPAFDEAVARTAATGWAAVIYTSHNNTISAPRYRIVLPLSGEVAATLPAVEVIADKLELLGVLDRSKIGPASLFYLPSCEPGHLADHQTAVLAGAAIDAAWMQEHAGAILAAREAVQAQQRAEALAAAEKRRAERIQAGFDPDASVIEAVRDRLDLEGELLRHGYRPVGDRFLFPGSETGIPGVHVLIGADGVQRAFSHHAADPLAAGNLPSWCRSKAVDAVDVAAILDHGGDLKATLRTLAQRFGIGERVQAQKLQQTESTRSLARLAVRMLRAGATSRVVLERMQAVNAALPEPVEAERLKTVAIWAARKTGGAHAG